MSDVHATDWCRDSVLTKSAIEIIRLFLDEGTVCTWFGLDCFPWHLSHRADIGDRLPLDDHEFDLKDSR